jgi:hypothetical protein
VYPPRRKSSLTARNARKEQKRLELNRESSNSTSNSTHGVVLAHSLPNSDGNGHRISTPTTYGGGNDAVLNGNRNWGSSCRTDGDSNNLRTVELMRGISGSLEDFGDPLDAGVNGDGAGVSGMRIEGDKLEFIDRVLGCEEVGEIYEDHSTLTVSFSSPRANRRRRGMR